MRFFTWPFILCLSSIAWGQEQVGALVYRTLNGQGMTLVIVDAGPGLAALKPEQGDAEAFRQFVQKRCVRESSLDRSAKVLKESASDGYFSAQGKGPLVRTATMTYWRYAPDLVMPARFKFKGQFWELIQANVPARTLN